ncbi:MAG: PEP-CTERM sorting domain-containing protein [Sedimentisphaerales bacterium]
MKKIVLLILVAGILPQFAISSILPIAENETVKVRLAAGYVIPKVGGIDLMVNGTEVGYASGMGDGVWAGCYLADIQDSTSIQIANAYKSFCMNALLDPPFSYANATAVAAVPAALEWMWGTYYDDVIDNAVQAAAFQLAYWEVMHETVGSWDIASGSFYLLGLNTSSSNNNGATFANLVSYANTYLNSNTWTQKAELLILPATGYQPFIVEIPEPATMCLLGLGGLLLRRKK